MTWWLTMTVEETVARLMLRMECSDQFTFLVSNGTWANEREREKDKSMRSLVRLSRPMLTNRWLFQVVAWLHRGPRTGRVWCAFQHWGYLEDEHCALVFVSSVDRELRCRPEIHDTSAASRAEHPCALEEGESTNYCIVSLTQSAALPLVGRFRNGKLLLVSLVCFSSSRALFYERFIAIRRSVCHLWWSMSLWSVCFRHSSCFVLCQGV